jgi:hypothetical protein
MDEKIQKIYNRTLELIQRQLNARLKGRKSEPIEMGLIRLFEICNRIQKNGYIPEIEPKKYNFDDDDEVPKKNEPNFDEEFATLSENAFLEKYGDSMYAQMYSKNLLARTKK